MRSEEANAWNAKGNTFYDQEEYEKAVKAYDEAIKINPKDTETWNNKGRALRALNKFKDAIKDFDKAIEIDQEGAKSWYYKGRALSDLEKHEEAIKAFDKSIEIDQEGAKSWYYKGRALSDLKKHEEAIKAYGKAIEIDPDETSNLYPLEGYKVLLRFPGFRWANLWYLDIFRHELKERLNKFDNLDSIPTEEKNRIRPQIAMSIGEIIGFVAWNKLIDRFFDKTFFAFFWVWIIFVGILMVNLFQSNLIFVYLIAFLVFMIGTIFIRGLTDWYDFNFFGTLLLYTIIPVVLRTSEIMWLSKVIQEGFIAGFILLATTYWVTFVYYRFYLFVSYFYDRKIARRYPEAVVINSLILALSLVNGKPEQRLGNDIKKELLERLEYIAYRLEKDLIRKLPSCDIETNVWRQRCGHQMATGIRLLKRCVLIPKKERRERLVATLGTRLVNAADGDWGLFEQVELSTVSTWSSRGLLIMRRCIAMTFPLLIVGIIMIIPIELSDTVMGYIFAASIGWAAITILTWLDPDYHEKIEAFKEKSDILPRHKK